jgi:purine nucleoside phosphorylase
MSCAPALQLAFELKIPVIMLGGVTNRAGVVGSAPLQHQLVLEEADAKIVPKLTKLFSHLIGVL